MTTLVVFLGFGLLFLLGLRLIVMWIEHRLLFPRDAEVRGTPEEEGLEAEDVFFCAEDGANLHGWWFRHPAARGVLLVCHGNMGNVTDRLWMAHDLKDVPLHKFIFDYRGYGRSRGIPSEKRIARDARAAFQVVAQKWMEERGTLPPVVLYGRSLGGGVALQIAAEVPIRALILESTFTSVLEIGRRFYPWLMPGLFCMNKFRSDLRIPNVRVPVLVAHSPDDEVIPYDMGERLYSLASNPWKFVRLSLSHDEAGWQTSAEYARAFRRLVAETVPEENGLSGEENPV